MVAVLASCLCGCVRTSEEDLMARAEELCLAAQWEEAKPLLKRRLLTHPDDPGAHFYLGRCYLLSADFRPVLAEGELQTALNLFLRNGKKSPIERFQDDYFELICHIESAKVGLMQARILQENGAQLWQLRLLLERSRDHAETARKIRPDSDDVAALEDLIREFTGPLRPASPRSKPQHRPVNT